ncbi:LOW QUALITY PROTEIN: histone-lysine N-methyltransferase ASHH2-like [Hibiscus syriacus]|uniref:LOW QUALITY PROTEIN: histone-lysine N-methyltransferase ASHH2-like n=1 Tax=Hibiscus syriacus TaxID=106335 RepID=UPI001923A8C4|nr:LOW QUALITY PROTEIN: histone-lysine N-methyltransferase ASHH2-like [Hibiscus syriacus]
MGSFGRVTLLNEPSLEGSGAEQHCCYESMEKLVSEQRDCVVIDSIRDCATQPGEDDNTGCRSSGDIDCRVGIKCEVQLDGSGMKELMAGECCENSVCLKKNGGEKADASCLKELTSYMCSDSLVCVRNNQGELVDDYSLKEMMGNRNGDTVVCLEDKGESVNDSDYSIENQDGKVDVSFTKKLRPDTYGDSTVCSNGNQSENLDGSGSKELIGDICGDTVVCLNDNQVENIDCSGPEKLTGYVDSTGCSNEIQCENVDSGSNELKGDRISEHGVCLNENEGNIDVHESKTDMCLAPLSIAFSGCKSDCPDQHDLKDSNTITGPSLNGESGASPNGESGASPIIEYDLCSKISTSCCAETISNLQRTCDSLGSYDWHNRRDLSSSDISLEGSTKPMEIRSNDDLCIELLASSISLDTQQNEQTDCKNVNSPSRDCVAEASEGTDVPTGTRVETSSETIISNGKAYNLNRGSFEQGANCLSNKSISLSCQCIEVGENGLAGRLDTPDLLTKEACAAISSSSSIDCFGQRENERKDIVKVDCVSETKNCPTASSCSRRRRQKSKSSRKAPAKRVARNCSSKKLQLAHENVEFHFKASRRKRSCLSKPARSSIWGLLNNITKFLEPCPDLLCNGMQNQEPSKGRGSRKRNKNRAGRKRNEKSGISKSSTGCLRLKIKVGKEVAPSNLNTLVAKVVGPSVSVGAFSNYGKENVVEDKAGEPGSEMQFHSKENREIVKTCSDAFITEIKQANKVVRSAEDVEKFAEYAVDISLVNQSDPVGEASQEAIENKCMDPGTSPDSEVINTIPDLQVGLIHQEKSNDMALNTSGAVKSSKGSKRGKKKENYKSSGADSIRKAKSSKSRRGGQKTMDNGFVSCKALISSFAANASTENELGVPKEVTEMSESMDKGCFSPDVPDAKNHKHISSSNHKRNQFSKSSKSQGVSKGKSRISDFARSRKGSSSKRREDESKTVSNSKVKEKGYDEEIVTGGGKSLVTVGAAGNQISDDNKDSNTGNNIVHADLYNVDLLPNCVMQQSTLPDNAWVRCDDCHKWRRIPVSLVKSIDEACRWVCVDNVDKAFSDCSIPQEKSNADINTELGISDAEKMVFMASIIRNWKKGIEAKCMTVSAPSHFWRLDSNQFLHRGRKTQTIDEVMVCQCERPPAGKLGCGDECLNRMLNIECVQGTCPCGDLCSNQQFQKHKYAKMKWDRFGKKGFGLRMLENISAGHFLIEYVGEVLGMQAYEARQKEYALRGQRHFYFMTLNGSEVIDAYVKGNLGRFINHSCDPNCRTEKWMVNGEICIGLFALRDIKKGEEVTFDYNYVRVFGAAAKKCHCGSPHCRGYIGGDSLSAEVIVHDDSDVESPEPMMLEDGETWTVSKGVMSRLSSLDGAAMQSVESVITDGAVKFENMQDAEDSVNHSASATSQLNSSVETEDLKGKFQLAIQPEEALPVTVSSEAVQPDGTEEQKAINKISCSIQKLDASLNMSDNKLSSDIIDANKKSKSDTAENKKVPAKSRTLMRNSQSSSSIKKRKTSSNSLNGNKVQITSNKSQVSTIKPRKFSENSSTGRFEAVEEKLNELLDSEGGITKRKDASKGYLKLLLLTATSGDGGSGEAIQSNRELSMILDALLKTKSGHVLTDIINKNGLQMLHNILKKYRRDFKKIPILRKLLKVLEYLAGRGILTQEHINGGLYCAGRESFRESILSFTEHDDKQVHQIARNFRDKWIRKPVRKHGYRDKEEGWMEFHRVSASNNHWHDQAVQATEAINSGKQSVGGTSTDTSTKEGGSSPSAGISQTSSTRIRKRKSRWDQPADPEKIDSRSPKKFECSTLSTLGRATSDHTEKMNSGDNKCHEKFCKGETINIDNGNQSFQQDAPPGFSSPLNTSLAAPYAAPSTATGFPQPKVCPSKFPDAVVAHPHKRFISRLPVSFGIPLPILQQFGSPQGESLETWRIAPGMPFHPFPPLPPCPPDTDSQQPDSDANSIRISADLKEGQQDNHQPASSCPDESIPSTAGGNHRELDISGTSIQQTLKKMRESSYDLGKKYFRQQKRKGSLWDKSESLGNNHVGRHAA